MVTIFAEKEIKRRGREEGRRQMIRKRKTIPLFPLVH